MSNKWDPFEYGDARENGTREQWSPAEQGFFEYHCLRNHDSEDAEAWYRDHQVVTILNMEEGDGRALLENGSDAAERAEDGNPLTYKVRFADGHVHSVFEDELFVSDCFFDPSLGPPAKARIEDERARKIAGTGLGMNL